MNYQPGLIVCTMLKTITSNNSNHLGDLQFENAIDFVIFLKLLVKNSGVKGLT